MNPSFLIIAFPFIPLFLMVIVVAIHTFFRRDVSRPLLALNHLLQATVGILLVVRFYACEDVQVVSLAPWPFSIVFQFDRYKTYFVVAYLTPLLFSFFRRQQMYSYSLRILFLFYLGGCSGLIVTGDVFNFFVVYELMIMAAYVLIASNREFYASVKYMLFGSISSGFFLAGIIALYAAGAYFDFAALPRLSNAQTGNFTWMLLLFCLAFLIKGAFFPVSAWVATCHAAAVTLVSAFLASFTIFSGIYGLMYLVLFPAGLGSSVLWSFLRWVSLATMAGSSTFVFFEPSLKRCVAGSTVYTIGFVGLLLSHRLYDAALSFMVVHALYKSLMFYMLDDLRWEHRIVTGRLFSLIPFSVSALFAAGLFPSLIAFLKYPVLSQNIPYRLVASLSAFFVASGFFKFRYRRQPGVEGWFLPATAACVMAAYYIFFLSGHGYIRASAGYDLALLVAALVGAPALFRRFEKWMAIDRRYIFPNLNVELFYTVVLFVVGMVVLLSAAR